MPTTKKDIDNTLVQSGYKPDSALSPNDIKELAKLVRGRRDHRRHGARRPAPATRSTRASSCRATSRSRSRSCSVEAQQPRRRREADRRRVRQGAQADPGNAGVRERHPRHSKVDAAIAAARKGIGSYPKATIARLCLASAYQAMKNGPRFHEQAVEGLGHRRHASRSSTLDRAARSRYQLQYDAYKAKNDTTNALKSLHRPDERRSDQHHAPRAGHRRARERRARRRSRCRSAKQLVADNPGDPQYARTYWLVLRAANNYKESVPPVIAYVAARSGRGGLQLLLPPDRGPRAPTARTPRPPRWRRRAPRSSRRTPRCWLLKAQNERKAGQLPAAKASLQRALAIDPKAPGANLLLAQISVDLGTSRTAPLRR